jgi:hypothetical protein
MLRELRLKAIPAPQVTVARDTDVGDVNDIVKRVHRTFIRRPPVDVNLVTLPILQERSLSDFPSPINHLSCFNAPAFSCLQHGDILEEVG